jgi:hypothetical protein
MGGLRRRAARSRAIQARQSVVYSRRRTLRACACAAVSRPGAGPRGIVRLGHLALLLVIAVPPVPAHHCQHFTTRLGQLAGASVALVVGTAGRPCQAPWPPGALLAWASVSLQGC